MRHFEKTLTEISELDLKLQLASAELGGDHPKKATLEAKLKALRDWQRRIEDRIRNLNEQTDSAPTTTAGRAPPIVSVDAEGEILYDNARCDLAQLGVKLRAFKKTAIGPHVIVDVQPPQGLAKNSSRALSLATLPERHKYHDAQRGFASCHCRPTRFYTCDKPRAS